MERVERVGRGRMMTWPVGARQPNMEQRGGMRRTKGTRSRSERELIRDRKEL